jgi:hypothetical protein
MYCVAVLVIGRTLFLSLVTFMVHGRSQAFSQMDITQRIIATAALRRRGTRAPRADSDDAHQGDDADEVMMRCVIRDDESSDYINMSKMRPL